MKYLALLVLLASVAAVGCKKAEDDAAAPTTGATAPAPKPAATPLTPEEYGPKLDAIQTPIGTAIGTLAGDKDAAKWTTDADALIKDLGDAADAVGKLTPPTGAEEVQTTIIKQINDMKDMITQAETDVKAGKTAAMDISGPLTEKGKTEDADMTKVLTAGGWDVKAFQGHPTVLKKADAAGASAGTPPAGAPPAAATAGAATGG